MLREELTLLPLKILISPRKQPFRTYHIHLFLPACPLSYGRHAFDFKNASALFPYGDGTWILYKPTTLPLGENFSFCPDF